MTTESGAEQKPRGNKPLWIGVLAVLLLLAAGFAVLHVLVLRAKSSANWFSDPAAERSSDRFVYHRLLQSPPARPPHNFADAVAEVQITTATVITSNPEPPQKLIFAYDASRFPKSSGAGYPFAVDHLQPGAPLEIAGARIELVALRTLLNYGQAPNPEQPDRWQWYNAKLEPIARENLLKIVPEKLIPQYDIYESYFPLLQLLLRIEADRPPELMSTAFFDARTKKNRYSAIDLNTSGTFYRFDFDPKMLHAGPVQLVFELAFGQPDIYEFPVERGAGFRNESFDLRLIECFRTDDPAPQFLREGGKELVTFSYVAPTGGSGIFGDIPPAKFQPPLQPPIPDYANFVFFSQPATNAAPLGFAFFDDRGNKVETYGQASGDYIRSGSTVLPDAPPVRRIRVTYKRDVRKLVLGLPCLPGLPQANREVKNLFDVRVPFARFRKENEIRYFLENLLQMEIRVHSLIVLNEKAPPVVFQNKTIREMLEEYCKIYNVHATVDPAHNMIYIGLPETFWQALQSTAKQFMQKLRRR